MLGTSAADAMGLAGLVGVVVYICAYAALQFGYLKGSGYIYTLANLVASALVLVSLAQSFNLSSAIIQFVWVALSLFGLARMYLKARAVRLTAEEVAFMESTLPALSRTMAHSFVRAGSWHDAEPGTRLASEGERLGALIYLADGEADIRKGNKIIARCHPGNFIGEMTCFDGGPASASVDLVTPARFFRISTEALNGLCDRDFEMRHAVHYAVHSDVRRKLMETNLRLHEATSATSA